MRETAAERGRERASEIALQREREMAHMTAATTKREPERLRQ